MSDSMKKSVSLPCLPGIHRVTPPYGRGRINEIFGKKIDKSAVRNRLEASGELETSLSTSSTLSRSLANTLSRSSLAIGDPARERMELLSSASIGSLLPIPEPTREPLFVKHDKQVLQFAGYYKEPVYESQNENWRYRKVVVSWFLTDNTVSIVEQKTDNSGIPEGPFLERGKHIVKPTPMSRDRYLEIEDMLPGCQVSLYSRTFMFYAMSGWTRQYCEETLGVEVPPDMEGPIDAYTEARAEFMSRETGCDQTKNRGKPMYPMKRYAEALRGKHTRAKGAEHRNHLFNGKVLEFTLVWEGGDKLYGHQHVYKMRFYLQDRTIAINNVFKPNSGIDPFSKFYARARLLKNHDAFGGEMGHENMDGEDDYAYYDEGDFDIGVVMNVNNRAMTIVNCSKFTREHYKQAHGKDLKPDAIKLRDLIDPVKTPPPPRPLPPHNGIGSEEDSVSNCKRLVIKPHRRDEKKLVMMEGKTLRFSCKLVNDRPADQSRRFVIRYFLADDTITVYEPPVHNSGLVGGKFIRRMRIKKGNDPVTGKIVYYSPADLYLGNIVVLFKHKFLITAESQGNWQYASDLDPESLFDMLIRTLRARGAKTTETFRKFDEDGDGRINFSEMKAALNSLLGLTEGNAISEETIAVVFRAFDQSTEGEETLGQLSINELSSQILGDAENSRRTSSSSSEVNQYLQTLKRRETEILLENERDKHLRDFVSNFEESRGLIRSVFRDQDEDHNNLLSGREFYEALKSANFNLSESAALAVCTWFFGESNEVFDPADEMTFADFAKKVQQLSMLPRMRGEI